MCVMSQKQAKNPQQQPLAETGLLKWTTFENRVLLNFILAILGLLLKQAGQTLNTHDMKVI